MPNEVQTADLQQKYRQFLDLLPLTVALSGLPPSEGRLFSEEQIEARAITVRAAYRVAQSHREGMPGRVVINVPRGPTRARRIRARPLSTPGPVSR